MPSGTHAIFSESYELPNDESLQTPLETGKELQRYRLPQGSDRVEQLSQGGWGGSEIQVIGNDHLRQRLCNR